jgi:N-acetylmuramoyl-L-alanine amidase
MKVALDAGHGMGNRRRGQYDPGAVSGGYAEADIVMAWVETAKFYLLKNGIEVFLVRGGRSDENPVGGRDEQAEAANADLFLSFHCNAAASAGASGTETFYRDSRDRVLAALVQNCAVDTLGTRDRGLKFERSSQHNTLAVFDFDGPACLLEIGFITNPSDRARMLDRDYRIAFADCLAMALKKYEAARGI